MMHAIDGARCFQAMVAMRDGVRLNTFVFRPHGRPPSGGPAPHAYGITLPQGRDVTDCTKGWLPHPPAQSLPLGAYHKRLDAIWAPSAID
jgi:predicted acyl esterase